MEQRSTRLAFFIAGFAGAVWAVLVPFAQARANLEPAALGLLLLCLGVGSLITMPVSGVMASRYGCRRAIVAATIMICVTLPALATGSNPFVLALALFAFGAGVGSVDCLINIQAVIVERQSGRAMMSGFHAMFSLGGLLGASGVATMLTLGAAPLVAAILATGAVVVALAWAAPHLLNDGSKSEGPAFVRPHGVVLLIAALCFIVFLTEGAALDWSAIYLSQERGLNVSHAGIGYAAFATTMFIGRLTGDKIVSAFGGLRVMVGGAICAAVGTAVLVFVPSWQAGIGGYALIGVGCSNIVPVLYSAIGRQTVMPEHVAIPLISTIGYGGILAGPALIGFVAQLGSLETAFALLAVSLLVVAASGRPLRALLR